MTTTRPKIKVASIINGKYLAFRKLGEGGCGVIYEVAMVKCPGRRFACKAETTVPDEDPTLPMEHKVISTLNEKNSQHCVELLEQGKGENYSYIVMSLLGPSLDGLRNTIPLKKFSTFSTIMIIVQALDSLKELHDNGFIHRDVKPPNFAIGALGTPKQRLLHILDFGIARQYLIKGENGGMVLRKPRVIVPFRGTLKYCSLATQDRKEQGRHDDLWSLFYMLVEFVKGSLPWAGLVDQEQVMKLKSDVSELFHGLDNEYKIFGLHLTVLKYSITPNYQILRDTLLNVFHRRNFNCKMKVDWEKGGRFDIFFEKKTATLPKVVENDMTEIDMEKMLKPLKHYRRFSKKEVLEVNHSQPKNEDQDDIDMNTANDDTLILSVDEKMLNEQQEKRKDASKKDNTAMRRYVSKTKSVTPKSMKVNHILEKQTAEEEEKKWKMKQDEQNKKRLYQRIRAETRGKRDVIVPEEDKTKKKGGM